MGRFRVIVQGPNLRDQSKGQFHVHAADCADNRHYGSRGKFGGEDGEMPVEVDDSSEVVQFIYGDQLAEHPNEDKNELINDWMSDFWFAPCLKDMP